MSIEHEPKQLLHLVFGGELASTQGIAFKDLSKLDIVGIYPNYREALAAWRGASQKTVDNAQMRYFVVHIHKLMEPKVDSTA
ncbi:MAG TPA: DUF4170 domain-containing protein [Rhizomicrobium sp.]|nr:DUF4170 domain-containing protein [Rhizomicrobium sp.]